MSRFKVVIDKMFGRYLLVTNCVALGAQLATGDLLEQRVVQRVVKEKEQELPPTDWERTKRMFTLGVLGGPILHYWYKLLDTKFKGRAGQTVLRKLLIDQVGGGPVLYGVYFVGAAMLEGNNFKESCLEYKKRFVTIILADWCVAFPLQAINFYFVPPHFRVLYLGTYTMLWSAFLSWMQHEFPDVISSHDASVSSEKEVSYDVTTVQEKS